MIFKQLTRGKDHAIMLVQDKLFVIFYKKFSKIKIDKNLSYMLYCIGCLIATDD